MSQHKCSFFPNYCTSVHHNVESVCLSNMRSYYGRAGNFGCPTCFQVMECSFADFVAAHKTHLGQFREATKLDIIRRIVPMPSFTLEIPPTIIPPQINVPQEVSQHVSPPNVCPQKYIRDFQSTSSYIPPPTPPFNADIDECEILEILEKQRQQKPQQRQQQNPQQQPEKSPSFDSSRHEDKQTEMLKESLSLLNENFVKSVRRSRKKKSELISYLTDETKEKANLQIRLEEMQNKIASLSKENMELKEAMFSLIDSVKEKEEEKKKRRKEKEDEKKNRRKEKEEEKRKRRKEKEEESLDRDIERQFKESQMERRTKEIVLEAIDEWNNRQEERKRQQKRDEEDSRTYTEKKRRH